MGLGFKRFQRINGEYRIHERIGRGSFAKVYRVTDRNGANFAAKIVLEKYSNLLAQEKRVLPKVGQSNEHETTYWHYYGRHGKQSVLVIDLLGNSLVDVIAAHGWPSLKSALLLGIQMTSRLEALHEKGFIHRDVKPENFVFGKQGDDRKCLYLIDYGFAKQYQSRDGVHRPNSMRNLFYGSKNFASLQAHKGEEQSRRSDLESVAYVIISILKDLPWKYLLDDDVMGAGRMKETVTAVELCTGLPFGMQTYYSEVRNLGYTERPDYDRLRGHLQATLKRYRLESGEGYEWIR